MTAPATPGSPGAEALPPETVPRGAGPVEVLAADAEPYGPGSGFESLVRPLAVQEFLDTRYRDKRPVLFRAKGPRFASLCTWEALNALLSSGAWRNRMHLVHDGKTVSRNFYTTPQFGHGWRTRRGGMEESGLDDVRMATFLRRGASLVMHGVNEVHPPIRPVAEAIEETLGGYTGVNLYASWTATRGFSVHWDDHDVFVLQTAGAKRWQLYGETRRFPLVRDSEPNVEPPREPMWSEVLRAGDVLYIPRGWWHDARAQGGEGAGGSGSLHLTCSVLPVTGLDFMEWLTGRLTRHETFRQDLPHPTDRTGAAHYAALRDLVLRELQGDIGGKFRDHLRSTWSEGFGASLGPFLDPWKSLDWERYGIRLRGARRATLERNADGEAVLEANGYRWTFDGRCMEWLAPLLRGGTVRVGAFRETVPEGTPAEAADEFLKLLVVRGVACTVPPASGPEQGRI